MRSWARWMVSLESYSVSNGLTVPVRRWAQWMIFLGIIFSHKRLTVYVRRLARWMVFQSSSVPGGLTVHVRRLADGCFFRIHLRSQADVLFNFLLIALGYRHGEF